MSLLAALHHRLFRHLPPRVVPYLPFRAQVLRMRPWKRDTASVTAALRVWCQFIENTRAVPGGIVELGVRAGDSLIPAALWARRRGIGKPFYGFDSFAGHLPALSQDGGTWAESAMAQGEIIRRREAVTIARAPIPDHFFGDVPLPKLEWVQRRLEQYGIADQVTLIPGWFDDTLPVFGEPLSLVKNDSDLYASTLTGLRHFWPLLSTGGVFLNMTQVQHPGSGRAVEEFFADRPEVNIRPLAVRGRRGIAVIVKESA